MVEAQTIKFGGLALVGGVDDGVVRDARTSSREEVYSQEVQEFGERFPWSFFRKEMPAVEIFG